jgi:hypothetical protein
VRNVAPLGGVAGSVPTASVADRAGSVRLSTSPEGVVVPALPKRVAAVKRYRLNVPLTPPATVADTVRADVSLLKSSRYRTFEGDTMA